VIKNLRFTFLIALLSLWLAPPILEYSQAQTVEEYTTADTLSVGDTFDFAITLERNDDFDEIIFPDSNNLGNVVELRSRTRYKPSSYRDSVQYQLQFFSTSDTLLPALPVHLIQGQDTSTVYTNPIPLHFQSVLSENDEEFRPFKPIFDFAAAWWPYILAILLVLIAAYVLYRYSKKERPPVQQQPEFEPLPFVNPLAELQNDINDLKNNRPTSQEEFEHFYIELGDAIRRYFEELYHIPAMESSSGEILRKLREEAIDRQLLKNTQLVLQEADMVKFAKFKPSGEQAQRALNKAHDFLNIAETIDAKRIKQLEQKHQQEMERKREQFQQEQAQNSAEVQS